MATNKNILLLIADDLGRDFVGCYGNKTAHTPHLDALAASGTQFDFAFTSTASCSGSRTVIYTGLHTHETGSYGLNLERNGFQTFPNVETAPSIFNGLGYKTGIIGKIHVSPDHLYPWQIREESDSRNVARIADRAGAFFQTAKSEKKPFFLTIGFVDPHRRLQTRGGFGNDEDNYDPRVTERTYSHNEVTVPPFLSDIPEVRQELVEYQRAVNRMDQGVGLILAALEREGLSENTLVLFVSDNGPPFVNSKTTLFEAGVRLPFLLRAPGTAAAAGVVNPNLVSYVDIIPTFLDWAGHADLASERGKVPRRGRSILPILSNTERQPQWGQVFGSHTFHEITNYWPTRFMRNQRFKYHRNVCWKLDFPFAMDLYASLSWEGMRNSASSTSPAMIGKRRLKDYICRPPEELFDLEADPLEIHNVADEPEHARTLQEMRAALEQWQKETNDLWLYRDGNPLVKYINSGYAREGLAIPDRFDFDADQPQSRGVATADLQ